MVRPAIALDARAFGKRAEAQPACATERNPLRWGAEDVRLFAATFAAGFIVVSILIG